MARPALALTGAALGLFAVINLFFTFTPTAARNEKIYAALAAAEKLPLSQRLQTFAVLAAQQGNALARKPSEPYGWARLSYLRLSSTGDKEAAFAALRMSDMVSPYEAPQLPERAYLWRSFGAVETPAQRAYQDELWVKAYILEPDAAWAVATQNDIVNEVAQSLAARDPVLYGDWKLRMIEAGDTPAAAAAPAPATAPAASPALPPTTP